MNIAISRKKFASKKVGQKLAVRDSALQNVWREKWQETEMNEKPNKLLCEL